MAWVPGAPAPNTAAAAGLAVSVVHDRAVQHAVAAGRTSCPPVAAAAGVPAHLAVLAEGYRAVLLVACALSTLGLARVLAVCPCGLSAHAPGRAPQLLLPLLPESLRVPTPVLLLLRLKADHNT